MEGIPRREERGESSKGHEEKEKERVMVGGARQKSARRIRRRSTISFAQQDLKALTELAHRPPNQRS